VAFTCSTGEQAKRLETEMSNQVEVSLGQDVEVVDLTAIRLNDYSNAELVTIHNTINSNRPLKAWKKAKGELIVRILDAAGKVTFEPDPTEPATPADEPPKPKTNKRGKQARKKLAGPYRVLEFWLKSVMDDEDEETRTVAHLATALGYSEGSVRSYLSYLNKGTKGFPHLTCGTKGGLVVFHNTPVALIAIVNNAKEELK
jgi:hypothetical protein